ncbi:MAG TPA: TIGR02266 family protein [Polyangiaceae bacterium]|nr:TIGR02266 family protein [Polyangiaceae bacterium]
MKDEAESEPPDQDEQDAAESASGPERRRTGRFDVTWQVDCETEDTFLYAYITNISEMGIFVKTDKPLPVGTQLVLRFAPPSEKGTFVLSGIVQWLNPIRPLGENLNPGMGIRFQSLLPEDRERIVEAVRTIAYVRQSEKN